jgi:hypothetical protein
MLNAEFPLPDVAHPEGAEVLLEHAPNLSERRQILALTAINALSHRRPGLSRRPPYLQVRYFCLKED